MLSIFLTRYLQDDGLHAKESLQLVKTTCKFKEKNYKIGIRLDHLKSVGQGETNE